MMLRLVKLSHFQPRLGIVSRTLAAAAGDMGHFMVVLLVVFFGCSWCAACPSATGLLPPLWRVGHVLTLGLLPSRRSLTYLVFGPVSESFNTLTQACQTNFNILMMQDSNLGYVFFNLPDPWVYPGVLYYWVYALFMSFLVTNIGEHPRRALSACHHNAATDS